MNQEGVDAQLKPEAAAMRKSDAPVCILGMHRSGTSMVARLLNLCGLYLGPDDEIMLPTERDNPAGYWENRRITDLNDDILEILHGAWDRPPELESGWSKRPEFESVRERALEITAQLATQSPWGWKDPRTLLTLEFWLEIFPEVRFVLCLRNPFEVAGSLGTGEVTRLLTLEPAVNTWASYHQNVHSLLSPEEYVITHYESYFFDPESELRRVADFLQMTVSEEAVRQAVGSIDSSLRRNVSGTPFVADRGAPHEAAKLYAQLCSQAGPVYHRMVGSPDYRVRILEARFTGQDALVDSLRATNIDIRTKLNEVTRAVETLQEGLVHKEEELLRLRHELATLKRSPLVRFISSLREWKRRLLPEGSGRGKCYAWCRKKLLALFHEDQPC